MRLISLQRDPESSQSVVSFSFGISSLVSGMLCHFLNICISYLQRDLSLSRLCPSLLRAQEKTDVQSSALQPNSWFLSINISILLPPLVPLLRLTSCKKQKGGKLLWSSIWTDCLTPSLHPTINKRSLFCGGFGVLVDQDLIRTALVTKPKSPFQLRYLSRSDSF